MMDRIKLLDAAKSAVLDRENSYGSPQANFDRAAKIWNVILEGKLGDEHEISAVDVGMMMCALKLSRLIENPGHPDSAVDLAGYAAVLAEIA